MNDLNTDSAKKKCLFVSISKASFVRNDELFFNKYFKLIHLFFNIEKSPFKLIWNLFIFSIKIPIYMSQVQFVYTWFTDYHSIILTLWSIIFQKPIFVVVGGYEVDYLPDLKYGGLKNPLRRFCITFSLNHATKLFAVSKFTREKAKKIISHNRIDVVYNGIDVSKFSALNNGEKLNKEFFLTAGYLKSDQVLRLKGVDRFIKLARCLPSEKFVIVGVKGNVQSKILENIPTNVKIYPFMPFNDLIEFYKKAKYYVQLSEVESFGMSVLESIIYGAIPIVSNQGALPEIFNSIGILVDIRNFESELIRFPKLLDNDNYDNNLIKKILSKYSLQNRRENLKKNLIDFIN